MSAKKKRGRKAAGGGDAARKNEILGFIEAYNAKHGGGGQAAASRKYKVSAQLIASWRKSSKGGRATTPLGSKKKGRGVRYSEDDKKKVVAFVHSHNARHGRGGQSEAARRFGLTVLTVSSWLKGYGVAPARASKGSGTAATLSATLAGRLTALTVLGEEIRKAEEGLASLRARFQTLASSLRAGL